MRVLKKIFVLIGLLAALTIFADVVTVYTMGHMHPQITKSDAIVVLGAAINSRVAYERAMKGLELFENHKAPVVVLSGGKIARPDISEAKYMSNVIAESSAEPVPMLLEEYSNNTYENIYNSKLLIPQAKSIVVVTDEFHIARSVLLAKRAGFAHVTWASPEDSYFPTAQLWFYYVREFVAMVHYLPKFIFG